MSQYPCDYPNLAPSGCTQYFFGTQSGTIRTYNYNSGNGYQALFFKTILHTTFKLQNTNLPQLANQQQQQCVRRERTYCRICYFAATITDFSVSGLAAGGALLAVIQFFFLHILKEFVIHKSFFFFRPAPAAATAPTPRGPRGTTASTYPRRSGQQTENRFEKNALQHSNFPNDQINF